MAKILIVDDDFELCKSIERTLSGHGFLIDVASTTDMAEEMLAGFDFDLIILDWMIPPTSGVDLLRDIRARGIKTPVIMLSGMNTVDHKSHGLDTGADDYLTKPFHAKELLSRVRAALRRPATYETSSITLAGITIDTDALRVTQDGNEVKFTKQEYLLLEFLMKNPDRVFSQEALASRAWSSLAESTPDTVRVHMSRIRSKLKCTKESGPIRTIHATGYIFVSQADPTG